MAPIKIQTALPPSASNTRKSIWIKAKELAGNGTTSFSISEGDKTLFELKGTSTSRIFELLSRWEQGEILDNSVNCFGAVDYVTGEALAPVWKDSQEQKGKEMSVKQALKSFQLPCKFQLINANGDVIHSAILLGCHKSIPIAFHKPGCDSFEICYFDDVLKRYSSYRKISFVEIRKTETRTKTQEIVRRCAPQEEITTVSVLASIAKLGYGFS